MNDSTPTATAAARTRPTQRQRLSNLTILLACVALLALPTLAAVANAARGSEGYRAEIALNLAWWPANVTLDEAIQTQVVVMTSRPVLGAAALEAHSSIDEIAGAVSAQQVGGSTVISVQARGETAKQAQQMVDAVVLSYQNGETVGDSRASRQRAYLESALAENSERLSALNAQIAAGGVESEAAQASYDLETAVRIDLDRRLRDLELQEITSPSKAEPIGASFVTQETMERRVLRAGAGGLLVGVVLTGAFLVIAFRLNAASGT